MPETPRPGRPPRQKALLWLQSLPPDRLKELASLRLKGPQVLSAWIVSNGGESGYLENLSYGDVERSIAAMESTNA